MKFQRNLLPEVEEGENVIFSTGPNILEGNNMELRVEQVLNPLDNSDERITDEMEDALVVVESVIFQLIDLTIKLPSDIMYIIDPLIQLVSSIVI